MPRVKRAELLQELGNALAQLRAAAAELQEQARAAAERRTDPNGSSGARTGWLANVFHDIRTPISTMLGVAEILREIGLDSEQRELVDVLERSGKTALVLASDILDFEGLDAGRWELEPVDVDPAGLVEDLVRDLSIQVRSAAVELVARSGKGVPEKVRVDARRLRQVLANLVGNAIKFTQTGHVAVGVSVASEGTFAFTVSDTGRGISADRLASIFEPYATRASVRQQGDGSGLGLSIVKGIVERMGGEVAVRSEIARGSRFTVCLPLTICEAPRSRWLEAVNPRVLVCSNSEVSHRSIAELLGSWGATVRAIADESTLHSRLMAEAASHDVVLLDVRMRTIMGTSLLDGLRGDRDLLAKTIVLLPLKHRSDDPERLASSGVAGWITIPLKREHLSAAINRALPHPRPAF